MVTTASTAKPALAGKPPTIGTNDIEQKISTIRSDISSLSSALADYGSTKAGEVRKGADKAAAELSVKSKEALDSAKDELARLEQEIASQVRRNPVRSVAIAAGIGFVAALLMRR